jgi:hypothetical protein
MTTTKKAQTPTEDMKECTGKKPVLVKTKVLRTVLPKKKNKVSDLTKVFSCLGIQVTQCKTHSAAFSRCWRS